MCWTCGGSRWSARDSLAPAGQGAKQGGHLAPVRYSKGLVAGVKDFRCHRDVEATGRIPPALGVASIQEPSGHVVSRECHNLTWVLKESPCGWEWAVEGWIFFSFHVNILALLFHWSCLEFPGRNWTWLYSRTLGNWILQILITAFTLSCIQSVTLGPCTSAEANWGPNWLMEDLSICFPPHHSAFQKKKKSIACYVSIIIWKKRKQFHL